MYRYEEFDKAFVKDRVAEFKAATQRRIDGVISEDDYKPLRLQNGLYLQLHAYMLRVAIPYGTLSSAQMMTLADIAERWDKGYGHFTTRQNIQFNWMKLQDVGDVLDALADADMHAIQTSGNCIRNVTADHFAGAAKDEVEDPRITAELLRQWSTGHPEFAFLPRKFKIAVTGAEDDRAVIAFHDIGIQIVRNDDGAVGYRVLIGGGLGRTPVIGKEIASFVPKSDLLPYLEAVLHIYNRYGRRDNKYKARIKILVQETGLEAIKAQIMLAFHQIKKRFITVSDEVLEKLADDFAAPDFSSAQDYDLSHDYNLSSAFANWASQSVSEHKDNRHVCVTISLKKQGQTPGDATADQMRLMAQLAKEFAYDELRVSHEQNIILPHVPKAHLLQIYQSLSEQGLATANIGLVSDIIACPGLDYCGLATARSIPVAQAIATHFEKRQAEWDIGPLKIKISGCINACGHHHVGHIGLLGLDRAGVENYQITLGGDGSQDAAIGTRTGPGFSYEAILPAIDAIICHYLAERHNREESFLDYYKRVGITPFKEVLYGGADAVARGA
ncbi:MAG: nitrite/sulfite reductase [Candidatus Puniceispirillaceae bacterium]